jgi:hypothetical protein
MGQCFTHGDVHPPEQRGACKSQFGCAIYVQHKGNMLPLEMGGQLHSNTKSNRLSRNLIAVKHHIIGVQSTQIENFI